MRLKLAKCLQQELNNSRHFNSIKVRLKPSFSLQVLLLHRNFNSIKVRLKLASALSTGTLSLTYFNSIKVRLKPQIGSSDDSAKIFQFHKGTIKTEVSYLPRRAAWYFNSIKVRLKLSPWRACGRWPSFQFHKGTIKTVIGKQRKHWKIISIP